MIKFNCEAYPYNTYANYLPNKKQILKSVLKLVMNLVMKIICDVIICNW